MTSRNNPHDMMLGLLSGNFTTAALKELMVDVMPIVSRPVGRKADLIDKLMNWMGERADFDRVYQAALAKFPKRELINYLHLHGHRYDKFNLVSWQTGSVKGVVRSTLSAEGYGVTEELEQGDYIRQVITEWRMPPSTPLSVVEAESKKVPLTICTDSNSLVDAVESDKGRVADKRLRIVIAMIREVVGSLQGATLRWVNTHKMLADPLTKVLALFPALLALMKGHAYRPPPGRLGRAAVVSLRTAAATFLVERVSAATAVLVHSTAVESRCSAVDVTSRNTLGRHEVFYMCIVLVLFVVSLFLSWSCGYLVGSRRALQTRARAGAGPQRVDAKSQAPCTYTALRGCAIPRFLPLPSSSWG